MPDPDLFLFVSYVREDRQAALETVDELERRGVPCWIAPRDVRPGRSFDDEIAEAIEASRAMLLIFSERCNDHEYIRREITVAGESHKVIIPFRIEDAQPRRGLRVRLSDLHWIDGFLSRERAIDQVVRTIDPNQAWWQEEERRRAEERERQRAEEQSRRQQQEEEQPLRQQEGELRTAFRGIGLSRLLVGVSIVAIIAIVAAVWGAYSLLNPPGVPTRAQMSSIEANTNRNGSDYRSFRPDQPDANRCLASCAREDRCRAWTYVHPGVQGPQAVCWLKSSVPPRDDDSCCVSGVKAAPNAQ